MLPGMSRFQWVEEQLAPSFALIIVFVGLFLILARLSELQELRKKSHKLVSSSFELCKGVMFFRKNEDDAVSPTASYKSIFPPLSRDGLVETWQKASKNGTTNVSSQLSEKQLQKNLLPFEQDYRVGQPSQYTTMGISVAEVKALGDFPDYATLTGVPLPKPYSGFKIKSALPRPYRPFRWAYHQTMCTVFT